MPQGNAWEREYQDPKLLSLNSGPQNDMKDFLRWLRREEGVELENLKVLDLGSGTGRNANYLAELGNDVIGLEISPKAVEVARFRATELGVSVQYEVRDIGSLYPFEDNTFDLVIDVTSSNSLNEKEREVYLSEVARVLKSGGHFFVRTLSKDGDKNAKNLIKLSPGPEQDTYINRDMGLVERVFSEADFRALYSRHFDIRKLTKKTSYARFGGQSYKRNYWLAYMAKG